MSASPRSMRSPSPDPDRSRIKRKRSDADSRPSSPPPPAAQRRRSRSPLPNTTLELPRVADSDPERRRERERQLALRMAESTLNEKQPGKTVAEYDAKAEFAKLLSTRSGGVYMPPARLRALQASASEDKASPEFQRLSWDALRKSITGIVNRVNIGNIKNVVPELFAENLIRGRGLLARSIMKAQSASLPYTPVFAALVAIINSKLPQVGELILTRLISQFRRSFKRNDKTVCLSTSMFIAHLVNQTVAHELVALEMLSLLLAQPSDDSVEIAVGFMREVGAFLQENSPKGAEHIFTLFRHVLSTNGLVDKRVQYMVEVLFQVRKDKYKDNPIFPEGLDLVQEEDQITHEITLEQELQVQESLQIFKFDPKFLENEQRYKEIKSEILGSDSEGGDSGGESDDESEDEDKPEDTGVIEDRTQTNLVNLRRVIYLTIMNSLTYEEAVHKLMKVNIQEGQEIELCKMIVECCSQERSYSNFYGLVGERFSKLNRVWCENFEEAFADYYMTIHRYETNRLRNIARFFGHLLASDSISWAVFSVVHINEDDTTSSSRIFIKILCQEISEDMGLKKMAERFKDPTLTPNFTQLFPMDNPKNTRFSINYFTSIGLGVVTEAMREHLQNAPRLIMEQRRAAINDASSSSDSSSDSDSSSSSSSSDSGSSSSASSRRSRRRRSPSRSVSRPRRDARRSRTPPRRSRSRTPSIKHRSSRRDVSPPRRRASPSRSRTPPRRRDASPPPRRRDISPPRRNGRYDDSPPRGQRPQSVSVSPPRKRPLSPRRPSPRRDASPPRRSDGDGYRRRGDDVYTRPRDDAYRSRDDRPRDEGYRRR